MATKRGYAYPIAIEDGNLALSTDYDLVREAIYSILETRFYERVMRPGYGTPDYVFTTVPNPDVIEEQVLQALESQIEDVDTWNISATVDDNGVVNLTIDYTVNAIKQPPIMFRLRS